MHASDAIYAFFVAFAGAALLTPLTSRLARAVGAVDQPKDRGLSKSETPLLGGLAMLGAVLLAALLFLAFTPASGDRFRGILIGAIVIALVGAIDDRFDLPPAVKLVGQVVAAVIPVQAGVEVSNITLPLIGAHDLGTFGSMLTVIGLVVVMNVVNLSDGIDGLAAGVCAISALTFSIIAFDLDRGPAAVLAAITAGAALGFLIHNFHPASAFMGDCGSNLLGLLLGCIAVEGAVKTQVGIALVFPLVVMAVPFFDTAFVVLKRLKYKRKPWEADANHLHHRLSRIGFSQRRAVLFLYTWTLMLGGLAIALRFVPYSDRHGHFRLGGSLVMAGLTAIVLVASVYLVYVLEILKFRSLDAMILRRTQPGITREEIDADVATRLETGEFEAVRRGTEEFERVNR